VVGPNEVHKILKKHLLVDGYDLVCDLERSQGVWFHDAKSGKKFLDMFAFFASLPLGMNHPDLIEPSFIQKLGKVAVNKVSNSDIYTVEMAEAVESLDKYAIPKYLPHLFLISGGSLAVENALKTAFDWKVRKNFAKGIKKEKGHQVIHFRHAFHGRSGYTLSLTNTVDPRKHQYFPKFDWPRVEPPIISFPRDAQSEKTVAALEEVSLSQIREVIAKDPEGMGCLIIEPIQGEGGDQYFRKEFITSLRQICDESEILLIADEVQTGFGITGKMWAHEYWDVKPDLLAFGKKAQVSGVLGGKRIDEVKDNVFVESSGINSTFGGNLVDIVRMGKILEVIHRDKLVENAARVGKHLLTQLQELEKNEDKVTSARGLGLMCAFDMPTPEERDRVLKRCYKAGMIILGCGPRSIRFRPALTVTTKAIDRAVDILKDAI